jgi:hypothetical protein
MEEIIHDPEFKKDVEDMRRGLTNRENHWKAAAMDGVDRRVTPNGQSIPASAPKIRLHKIVSNEHRGSPIPTSTNSTTDPSPRLHQGLSEEEPEYNAPNTPLKNTIRTPTQSCLNALSSGPTTSSADLSESSETPFDTDVNVSTEVSRLASDVIALTTDYATMELKVEAQVSTLTAGLEAIVGRVARIEANADTGDRTPVTTSLRAEISADLEAVVERVARIEANADTGDRTPVTTPLRAELSSKDNVQDHTKAR